MSQRRLNIAGGVDRSRSPHRAATGGIAARFCQTLATTPGRTGVLNAALLASGRSGTQACAQWPPGWLPEPRSIIAIMTPIMAMQDTAYRIAPPPAFPVRSK